MRPGTAERGKTGRREREAALARIEALARLMDGNFTIPGTRVRFGLDAVVGLVPVGGDLLAGIVSTYLIWEARRLGAPRHVLARMVANSLVDTAIGSVPVLGDAFDVLYRSNLRNMRLLRRWLEKEGLLGSPSTIEGEARRVA